LFGMNTAAARLPGFLFALLGIASTGWVARVLFDPLSGWIAATCYATMALPFMLSQAPVHDMALVPFTNLAVGFLWKTIGDPVVQNRRDSLRHLGFAGAALGLSILTKGLEGIAIVGVGYGVYLLLSRRITLRVSAQSFAVVLIAMLVALPWYLAMESREPGYL